MKENSYKKHLFNNLNDMLNEMNSGTCNLERRSMFRSLQKIIKKLKEECIFTFPNISQTLKDCGMSSTNIKDFLLEFAAEHKLHDISTRSITKSNKWEKNIIFAYICIDNSINLVEGLEKFYLNNNIKWKKKVNLRSKIQNDIIEIVFQKSNHNSFLNNNTNINYEMVNQNQAPIEMAQTTSNDAIYSTGNISLSEIDENPINTDDCYFDEDDFFTELFF